MLIFNYQKIKKIKKVGMKDEIYYSKKIFRQNDSLK